MQAQPYYFKHYQVENGLSNNSIFCSVQDQSGLMWFGTKDGVNRFDGYSFKTYRHDPANQKSLGNDKIHTLASDQNGHIWVGTDLGAYEYNPVDETFTLLKETLKMSISLLQTDLKGNLWILSAGNIYTYDQSHKQFSVIQMPAGFVASYIYCRPNGQLMIAGRNAELALYDHLKKSFLVRYRLQTKQTAEIGLISVIKETTDQQLVIGTTTQGVKLFDLKTQTLKDIITLNKDKTHIFVRDITIAKDNEFWIGTESGLYIYNHDNKKIVHLQKQFSNPYTLSDNAIYKLCRDKDGGIWIGTYFGGINYYAAQSSIFTKYFPAQQQNAISGSDVREICKDQNGNLWIGTEDAGLNKLNLKTSHFTSFSPDGSKYSIAHSNVHGLLADGNQLWIGTFEHGLDLMDINTGLIIKHYNPGREGTKESSFVLNIYKTKTGNILIACTTGLYQYNRKKDSFEAVPGLPLLFFNNITEDSEGMIWAGTFSEGVFRFKPGAHSYQQFKHDEKDNNSLGNNTINCIFEDSRKNIWITTDGGGLSLFNQKKSLFRSFNIKHGLPGNFLFRILEDEDYQLWISSTRGLIRFDPISKNVKVYTKTDGLLTDQFNYNSSYKDTNGRMFFGSVKGMISFQPEQLKTTSKTASMFLTGFQIDNTERKDKKVTDVLTKSILYTKEITLNHNQSSFSIDFAALSYFSPDMTEYAYKMSGLYQNWEYLKTNRKVYFTKLAPGAYIFEAKAMINGSNKWSKNNVKLHIIILPPFWKSNIAYLLYTLSLAGLAALIIREYHHRIQLKNKRLMELFEHKKETEIYQAKISFFTNVAHEIRTPLTLIKGPMEKLMKLSRELPVMEKNLKIMDRNTDRLLNLTNQLLDFRKTETDGFSLNFVKLNIQEILQDIAVQFSDAAEQKNISYQTILPPVTLYAYADQEAFYKIISNLVDNAIKYGESEVRVSLVLNENQDLPDLNTNFEVQVCSDGNKIAVELQHKIFKPFFRAKATETKRGTGIGLSISRSLAELHKGYLYLQESNNAYNLFILRLPVHQKTEFNLKGKWKKI